MANVVVDPKTHPEAVLGDFKTPNPLVTFKPKDVAFVYGSKWKQRYFVKRGDDYYVLGVQWNVITKAWSKYHVDAGTDWWAEHYPDDQMQRPTGPLCDGCHSIELQHRDQAAVTEWNVGCEKCHGPGAAHVASPKLANIVNPARLDQVRGNDVCIQCHSQGQPLQKPLNGVYYDWPVGYEPGKRLSDYWRLEEHKLGEETFTHWPEGSAHKNRMQGNDFVQSQMYTRGVACWSCHDVHGTENNALTSRSPSNPCARRATRRRAPGPERADARAQSSQRRQRAMRRLPHAEDRARDRRLLRAQPHVPLHSAVRDRALQGSESVHDVPSRPDDRERDRDDPEMARGVAVASAMIVIERRHLLQFAIAGMAGALFVRAPRVIAADTVRVTRKEPVIQRFEFDSKRPIPGMPKLTPPEAGVCNTEFALDCGMACSIDTVSPTAVKVTVDELDLGVMLTLKIYAQKGSPAKLHAHEEGHAAISQYYYKNAVRYAQEVGKAHIGKSFDGAGRDKKSAQHNGYDKIVQSLEAAYMPHTRVSRARREQPFRRHHAARYETDRGGRRDRDGRRVRPRGLESHKEKTMQYARLGETGLIVSRLALGSMTFGAGAGIFASVAKVDQKGANDLVARAIDGGINFFNSADVYAGGESERILGKAIGPKRRDVVIATKVGNRMGAALIDVRPVAPAHPRGRRREPRAARHGLHRRLSRPQGRCAHADRGDDRGARGPRARRQGALRRLLELVRVAGGEGRRHPARARLDAVPRRRDVLLARRPRSRARGRAVLRGRRHRRDGLEPARGRLPERQVHARQSRRARAATGSAASTSCRTTASAATISSISCVRSARSAARPPRRCRSRGCSRARPCLRS